MAHQKNSRYDVSEEEDYEPGSHRKVLKNLLEIKRKKEMDLIEASELMSTYNYFIDAYEIDYCFTVRDICYMHEYWLKKIYPIAGKYRRVNVSKNGFLFARADLIQKLMNDFEKNFLRKYTPCNFKQINQVIQAIAAVHVELILIHPFREGNGRIARFFASLMALQAGLPLLDFSGIKGKKRQEYFIAVQQGSSLMEKFFSEVIERTLSGCSCS